MHDLSAKELMRRDLRRARADFVASLSPDNRRLAEAELAARVAELVASGNCVASYAPMGHEIDPAMIEQSANLVALPWFAHRFAEMEFRIDGEIREPGPWGVAQPSFAAERVRPDILLIPLVGATKGGDRLGQGQGHFDRLIAALRADGPLTTIGLAWNCQIVDKLPTDPWDETLDYIATPAALYRKA